MGGRAEGGGRRARFSQVVPDGAWQAAVLMYSPPLALLSPQFSSALPCDYEHLIRGGAEGVAVGGREWPQQPLERGKQTQAA